MSNYIMTPRHIEIVAQKIYNSCLELLNDRLEYDTPQKNIYLQQLNEYYNMTPKDRHYLNNLQFLYENWCKLSKVAQKPESKKEVVYFYKPFSKNT